VPGDRLEVKAVLESRSVTPIECVEMRLNGTERRYSHTRTGNNTSSRVYKTHTLVALMSRTEPRKLDVGKYEYRTIFDLPKALPPSHADAVGSVRYSLDVRVKIPWWPDRHEHYEVNVLPTPWRAAPEGGRVFATHPDGPVGGEAYIEATLDPTAASVGGTLRGAIAVTSQKPVKQMKLYLVAMNEARFQAAPFEVRRFEFTLRAPPAAGGQGADFALALPKDESPSFDGALQRLRWHLEAKAELGWRRTAVLQVPLVVAPLPPKEASAGASRHLPPVGRERRAKVWAHVANRHGLVNDADSETMTGNVGAVGLRIALEQRGDGLFSVATLTWPDLEIGLAIREKRWADTFSSSLTPVKDARFKSRFFVEGRDDAQVAAVLAGRSLVRDLMAMPEATLEDDGALLAAQGGGHRLDNLDAFVGSVRAIASAAGEALTRVPPPKAMLAAVPQWDAFARLHQARLVMGSVSLRELYWEGVTLDVATEWEDGMPARTRASHKLAGEVDRTAAAIKKALDEAAAHSVFLSDDGTLHHVREGALDDPSKLAPVLDALAAAAKDLTPSEKGSPYR
jgi:hypothetical protein